MAVPGPAGELEVLLEVPETAGAGVASAPVVSSRFAVLCHPHPLHGGTMHNKVVHTLARAMHYQGIPSLRFNFRGVGSSAGVHDEGRGETDDTLAVIAAGQARWPGSSLVLAGFSFGAVVAMRAVASPLVSGVVPSPLAALITVAPAVDRVYADGLPTPACPWLLVMGEADEIVSPATVRDFAARQSPPPQLAWLPGVGHFFHGHLHELQQAVLDFL